MKGPAGLVSGETSFLDLQIATCLLCPYEAFLLCMESRSKRETLVSLPFLIRTLVLPV